MIPTCEKCPNGWVLQSYEDEISSVARKATDMSPDELFDVITGKLKDVKQQTTQDIPTQKVEETINQTLPGWFNKDIFTDNTKQEFTTAKSKLLNWLFNGQYLGKSFLGSYMKIPIILEPYVNLFEDTAYLLYCLIKSSSSAERYMSIVAFCKLRGSRLNSASALTTVLGNILFDKIRDTREQNKRWKDMQTHVLREVNADMKLQSYDEDSNPFRKLRMYMNKWDKVKESMIVKKLHSFGLYILTLGILDKYNIDFDTFNYTKYEAAHEKRKHRKGLGMIECFLDTGLFVCERGHEFFHTGDVSAIFHSGSDYEKWMFTAQKLVRDSLVLNNPEPHGVNRFTFLSDLKDTIEKGQGIVKFTSGLEKGEKLQLQKLLNDLMLIESNELTKREAQKPRKDPFGVLLHGCSNICKSQLKQILFYHYAKCFDLPCGPEYMYTRVAQEEYWSGFNSSQWCVVMDDIGYLRPTGEMDPSLAEMLQVKNSVPFVPPQAELNDKGRTPVRPELLIATTNTEHLNLNSYFACPFAVARRLGYIITARVKPEYSKWNMSANSEKIPITPEGEYMNIWDFTIKIAIPATDQPLDNQQAKYEIVQICDNIHDMLEWFISMAKKHEESQKKALAADATMAKVEVCKSCFRAIKYCSCTGIQQPTVADEDSDAESEMYFTQAAEDPPTQEEARRASTRAWDAHIFQNSLQGMRDVTKFKLWFVGNTICHSPNTLWFEDELFLYWDMLHSFKWIVLIFCMLHSFTFSCIFLGLGLLFLFLKYCFVLSAHFYQWKYGTYWKVRLATELLSNEQSIWRLIFRLAGNRVNLARYRLHPHVRIIGTFIAAIITAEIAVNWLNKKLFGETDKTTIKRMKQAFEAHEDGRINDKDLLREQKRCFKKTCGQAVVGATGFATAITAGFAMNSASEGVKPEPNAEKPSFYFHDPYHVTEVDVSSQSKCAKPGSVEDLARRNIAQFQFIYMNIKKRRMTTAVNIHGNIWCFNKHSMKGDYNCTLNVIMDPTTQNVSRNTYGIVVTEADIIKDEINDLAFIELRCLSPGKSLLPYLPKDSVLGGCHKGKYLMIDASGTKTSRDVINITACKCPLFGVDAYSGKVPIPTVDGDCGSVCIATVSGAQVILGLHTAGDYAAKVVMHQLSLARVLNCFDIDKYVSQGTIKIDEPGYERKMVPVHEKAAVRFVPQGTGHVIGSFAGYRPVTKSKVEKTFICDFVRDQYPVEFCKPPMGWQPWAKAIRDMTSPSFTFDNQILKQCALGYFVDICKGMPDLSQLQVYDLDTALNGADGVTYVDKVNVNTSAGLPFRGSKKKFLEIEDGKIVSVDNCIIKRMGDIITCYEKGERFHAMFCGHLKDDPLEWKKCVLFKTRVFTCGEFAWSIVVRRFFLSHVRMIQNNPFLFEAMPGIVAQSEQWHELYDYLTKHGKHRMIAGDYGKYDKNMAAPFILAAFDILIRMSERAGWSQDDIKIMRGIAYDTAFPTMDFHGDLVEMQGNPSGHPLTVIINCIVNSLYMRYAYVVTTGKPAITFKQHVNLATYGDDNAMSVAEGCDLFNHTSIANVLASIGVEYTMADKESESKPFIDIDDISFLKRKFRWDDEIKSYMGILEEKSINKMLTSYVNTGVLAPEAHSICAIETALREYFFYGREKFEERKTYLRGIVEKANLTDWLRESTFPSYNQMAIDFWNRHISENNALIAAERIEYFGAASKGVNPPNHSEGLITQHELPTDE